MKTGYKKSQFNYIVDCQEGYLVYNTLYNSLTRLSNDEYQRFFSLAFHSEDEREAFENQGMIVKENIDELRRYNVFTALASKYIHSKPTLTVTPTMACNASCFYCYENGVRCGDMSKEQAYLIVEAIKTLDLSRGLHLTWFGGEPLLNQRWMDDFADCLRAENIEFSAFLISNGSLIDDYVIEKMKNSWNVSSIQVSFDGDADEYAKRKAYHDYDENIYYKMLKKIRSLSKAGISVQIRLNIDRDNIDSILCLVNDLEQFFGKDVKVSFYPAFLTGSKEPLTEKEKIDVIKKIISADTYHKLPVNSYLYKLPKLTACYYYSRDAFSVDTNGYVYICERMLGAKEKAVGSIGQKIDLSVIERSVSGRRDECQKCIFFPKCQGGCQEAYNCGDDPCFVEKYAIKAYLENLSNI